MLRKDLGSGAIEHEVLSAPRSVDISSGSLVDALVREVKPSWVINCAAFTQVDRAHQVPDQAMRVNSGGAANLAMAAESVGARMIHVSTEAVFSGTSMTHYSESDKCEPVSIYGISKLAGDMAVRALGEGNFVLRPSWLYSLSGGANFPSRLLNKLKAGGDPVPVVDDLFGNPTPVDLLAEGIGGILQHEPGPGVYHFCCSGLASKFEWAQSLAELWGFEVSQIIPSSLRDFASPAKRPPRVDLNCEKFSNLGLLTLPSWQSAMQLA